MNKSIEKMNLAEYICEKLKSTGEVKAKKMFGTYNICLDQINLGVVCIMKGEGKWYLKKTPAGDMFLNKNNIILESGIEGNSYIVKDFSNEEMLCSLAEITRDEIIKSKK